MKASELREQTGEELEQRYKDLKRELFKTRFANHTNQLDDTGKSRRLRRDIARVHTVLGERARGAAIQPKADSAENEG